MGASMTAQEQRVYEHGPAPADGLAIIYDGDCPFCNAYVRLVRLKEAVGPVRLIDARRDPETVLMLRGKGIEIDDTMAVTFGGATYAGAAAIELLSLLSSDVGLLNRMMARLLRDKRREKRLYPLLRLGRNLALRLLGRRRIDRRDRP
jgi:predicted DCC family thiol-disulfide oxidoreductase YuxK